MAARWPPRACSKQTPHPTVTSHDILEMTKLPTPTVIKPELLSSIPKTEKDRNPSRETRRPGRSGTQPDPIKHLHPGPTGSPNLAVAVNTKAGPTQSVSVASLALPYINPPPSTAFFHHPPSLNLFFFSPLLCCSEMAQETTVAEVVVKERAEAVPVPEAEEVKKAAVVESVEAAQAEVVEKKVEEEEPEAETGAAAGDSPSFKEESNRVADLPDLEKKAVEELKLLVKEALEKHEFSADPAKPDPPEEAPKAEAPAEEPTKAAEAPAGEPTKAAEAPAEEPTKADEAPAEEPTKAAEVPAEEPAKAAAEEPTEESAKAAAEEPPKSEDTGKAEAVVVEEVAVAAAVSIDDDGAKTVEAIEETVVAVAAVGEPPSEETAVAETAPEPPKPAAEPEVVEIWGVPLLADERTDVVLLKFLRARDFKVKEAFAMIKNTVRWRREFGIDALLEEDLGHDLDSVVFTSGVDKEGHPVCYNVYGEFQNKELYDKTFGDAEKRQRFLRWRIQFLEKSIRSQLDFSPTGICTFVQVMDLKNSPGMAKRELRLATNQALNVLQDNYPEFAAKQVCGTLKID